ncbi:MAG: GNAT family N-acetyltransferase [Flavobacteriales bacterium]|nr:GNAT family N-acetyltransferase [Flavobacteriales bacterium]
MKKRYISLVSKRNDVPIFLQPWWLDAVVEKNSWSAVLVEEERVMKACFTYILKKKGPFKSLGMPHLTPYLGFWFYNRVKPEKLSELISMLPKHDKFYMKMSYKLSSLQLDKHGYDHEELYTYVLKRIKKHDKLQSQFRPTLRSTIKKAEAKIRIFETNDVKTLFELCEMSFKRQSKVASFSFELIKKIYNAAMARNCCTILMAEDDEGKIHAATMLVWDQHSAYYLLNGVDPKYRSSGANSLLMWDAIKYSSQHVDTFDFEGSMIPGVESFIKGFGAEKREYALYTKTNSKIVGTVEALKKSLKKRF